MAWLFPPRSARAAAAVPAGRERGCSRLSFSLSGGKRRAAKLAKPMEGTAMAMVIERKPLTVRPIGAALSAEIEGVDLAMPLAADALDSIKRAWGEHLVLRFRGQTLSDDDLMRFSRHFGELDWAPV